jgi:peptide/nickel transport system permease protein
MRVVVNSLHWLVTSLRLLTYNKVGFVGFLVVVVIVLTSYVGPYFVPLDTDTKQDKIYQPPSAEFWLGTDHQGRDIFSQIVNGGKDVIYVATVAALLSTRSDIRYAQRVSRRLDRRYYYGYH